MTTTVVLDEQRVEAFAGKMIGALNASSLALMCSIGHQTGLFDAMADLPPASSSEIAKAAGLQERYVREWLAALVTSEVIEFNPTDQLYSLPGEHAALLTRSASPDNLAATTQWIAVLGSVESQIVDCFTQGGGVPYEAFHRFHQVMAEESAQTCVAALEDHILPLAPGLTERLEAGIKVLDVGCGAGRAINHLAAVFPNSQFVGYDLCEEAISAANSEVAERGLSNIQFDTRDVSKLDNVAEFDLITAFDAVHDQADPAKVLDNISKALKDDGTFLVQDIKGSSVLENNFENPVAAFLYTISCMHCMTVSLSQGGAGLGAMWGKELAEQMFGDAGFKNVDVKELDHDIINYYYVCTK